MIETVKNYCVIDEELGSTQEEKKNRVTDAELVVQDEPKLWSKYSSCGNQSDGVKPGSRT